MERRIARLTAVLETDDGAGVASIVAKLRQLEQRQASITRELEGLNPVPRLPQQVVQSRLDEWRRLLRANTTQGRAVLQRVIQGRITFTPTETGSTDLGTPGYDFEAPTRFDKLFSGVAAKRPASLVGDTTGCENISPEDTFDADYGALLEQAYGGHQQQASVGSELRKMGGVPKGTLHSVAALPGRLDGPSGVAPTFTRTPRPMISAGRPPGFPLPPVAPPTIPARCPIDVDLPLTLR